MKVTPFSKHLCTYIEEYLPNVRNYSTNTILSYQDSFRLLEEYMLEKHGVKPYLLDYKHFTEARILDFLEWLETERNCCASTCNQRLSALSAFLKYASMRSTPALQACITVANIPQKKVSRKPFSYFSVEELGLLFQMPDLRKDLGRRDLVLLCVLYDSGARAQELCDLTVKDVHFSKQPYVILHGKGGKTRFVPLMERPAKMLKDHIARSKTVTTAKNSPIFFNQRGEPITPACIRNLIQKYVSKAQSSRPDLFQADTYSPHSMRHSKAVHMLEAGVDMVFIRDFLGHASIQTTEIYASVSQALLNKTLRARKLPALYPNEETEYIPDLIPDYLKRKQNKEQEHELHHLQGYTRT